MHRPMSACTLFHFAFDPAWGVPPVIAEHYPLIVDHIWRALRA